MKIYFLLTGLQVGWAHWTRLGTDDFGSVVLFYVYFDSGT